MGQIIWKFHRAFFCSWHKINLLHGRFPLLELPMLTLFGKSAWLSRQIFHDRGQAISHFALNFSRGNLFPKRNLKIGVQKEKMCPN